MNTIENLQHIAVLGAGKMGSGIAQFFATKGHPVTVIYVYDDRARGAGQDPIRKTLEFLGEKGVVDTKVIPDILSRIAFVERIEDAADVDLVIECVVEDLAVKQEFFRRMDEIFPPRTVLASNTSAISITEIGSGAVHRDRILGTHFWDPPFLIPLVEVIKTGQVSKSAVERVYELLKAAGKKPVLVQKDVPGFLANRMQHALFREALSIVQNGIASPQDVDDAIKYGFGMRLGVSAPIEVMDRGGMDLTYSIHKYLFPHLEDSKVPLKILQDKIDAGQLGFKSGGGMLQWDKQAIEHSNENLMDGLIKVASALGRL